jgi:hypothetical protein
MLTIKNANNMLEILDENGQVISRILKTEENQEMVNSLLSSPDYQVTNFNVEVIMPSEPVNGDWRNSLIG